MSNRVQKDCWLSKINFVPVLARFVVLLVNTSAMVLWVFFYAPQIIHYVLPTNLSDPGSRCDEHVIIL